MNIRNKWLVGSALFGAIVVGAAGVLTNGLPTIPYSNSLGGYPQLGDGALIPADTNLPNGQFPQSVAASPAQVAMMAVCMNATTGTTSSKAVTTNSKCAAETTESLSTAAGATDIITVTDSYATATSVIDAAIFQKGSVVAGADPRVVSVVPSAGSFVVTFKNYGSAAVNGTLIMGFFVRG